MPNSSSHATTVQLGGRERSLKVTAQSIDLATKNGALSLLHGQYAAEDPELLLTATWIALLAGAPGLGRDTVAEWLLEHPNETDVFDKVVSAFERYGQVAGWDVLQLN